MKISIGCDHAAYHIKLEVIQFLKLNGYEVINLGTNSEESVDYPTFGHMVGTSIINKDADRGIVICGSGIGISIAANKIRGIRAALCTSVDHAIMSRKHNNANVLALGARITPISQIKEIINSWLKTDFDGGRHQNRIEQIEID